MLRSRLTGLLEAQGVVVRVPRGSRIDFRADVIVAPLAGSPEYSYYARVVEEAMRRGTAVIEERDAARALYRALAYPWDSFPSVAVGVDPGGSGCAGSAVAEGLLLWVWRGGCSEVGNAVESLAEKVPHDTLTVYLGDGPGFEEAEASLTLHGIGYAVVPEDGSTKRPLAAPALAKLLDRHVLASATIAFRGLTRGQRWGDWRAFIQG